MGVSDDALLRRIEGPLPPPFLARVSGVFEPTAATDPYWWGDLRLHRPIVNDTNAGAEYVAYGMFGEEQLATAPFVVDGTTRMRVQQRRDLDPGLVTVDNSDEVVQTLRDHRDHCGRRRPARRRHRARRRCWSTPASGG